MAVISSIIAGITAAATAIGSAISAAASAIGGFLSTTLIGGSLAIAPSTAGVGTIAAAGMTGGLTVGGALAGVGAAAMTGIGLASMYQSARASASMNQAQIDAVKQLSSETGQLEVNNTAKTIQENTGIKRTLSSLRVPLGITPQQKDTITQNVYGVDTNTVATATQNMTGLNIIAA